MYGVGGDSETRPGIVSKFFYTLILRVLSRPEMGLPLVSGWGILTFAFPLENNFQAIPKSPVAREFPAFLAPHAPAPTPDSGVVIRVLSLPSW